MLNQEERDLELALSLQEQEIEERRAWVVALAGGQQYTRGQHHQRLNPQHPLQLYAIYRIPSGLGREKTQEENVGIV